MFSRRRHLLLGKSWWAAFRSPVDRVVPVLVLDYAGSEIGQFRADGVLKTFGDLHTFTRASTATVRDLNGIITTSASGAHRLDHDKDGNRIGLLIEEARTNELTKSEDASHADWTKTSGVTVSSGDDIIVKGITLNKIVGDTGTFRNVNQLTAVTVSAGDDAVYSVFIQDADVAKTVIRIDADTNDHRVQVDIDWDGDGVPTLGTNTVLGDFTYNSTESKIEDFGGGLYRAILSINNGGAGALPLKALYYVVWTPAPGGTITAFVGGHQIELGSVPTSYIPTTTVAVTREAEVCEVATSAFAFSTTVGSFAADAGGGGVGGTDFATIVSSDVSDRAFLRKHFTDNDRTNSKLGNDLADNVGGSSDFRNGAKCAGAYTTTALWVVMAGVSTGTDTGTLDIGSTTKIYIGSAQGSLQWWNSHIKEVIYYPSRLSNADLEAYVG